MDGRLSRLFHAKSYMLLLGGPGSFQAPVKTTSDAGGMSRPQKAGYRQAARDAGPFFPRAACPAAC